MYNFDHIVNWKLLQGSHEFPGPDGGTCINEAAIIVAGFEYKKVSSAEDCPPCFSKVLSEYSIGVNDLLPDDKRQQLMKYVMRLSGSVDTVEVEQQRAKYVAEMTIRKILPIALRSAGLTAEADRCEAEGTYEAAQDAANAAYAANAAACAAYYAADAAACAADYAADAAAYAADAAANAARDARDAAIAAQDAAAGYVAFIDDSRDKIYAELLNILEGAFAIGKQASIMDIQEINTRLESSKKLATV